MRRVLLWGGILLAFSATALTMAGTLRYMDSQDSNPRVRSRTRTYAVHTNLKVAKFASAKRVQVGYTGRIPSGPINARARGTIALAPERVQRIAQAQQSAPNAVRVQAKAAATGPAGMRSLPLPGSAVAHAGAGPCQVSHVSGDASFPGLVASTPKPEGDVPLARPLGREATLQSRVMGWGSAIGAAGFPDVLGMLALDARGDARNVLDRQTSTSTLVTFPPKPAVPTGNSPQPVPEPSCASMLLCGVVTLGGTFRRRRK